MSIISLARRRIAQLVTSVPDDNDLLWSNSESDETIFLTQIRTEKPEVAILTSEYADQPHLFTNVRQTSPGTRIILCVLPDAPKPTLLWPLINVLDLDVLCSFSELNDCLQTVVKGHLYVSTLLATHSATLKKESFPGWRDLTQSEQRVLKQMTDGKTGPQIANLLYISPKTVDNHKSKISQKLNVNGGPGSLVKFALLNRRKLLTLLDEDGV